MVQLFHAHLPKILIVVGVWMWVWYAILKFILEIEVTMLPFLACHLLCVIPASIMTGRGWMIALAKKLGNRALTRQSGTDDRLESNA